MSGDIEKKRSKGRRRETLADEVENLIGEAEASSKDSIKKEEHERH
jgi:hypothetical protein